MELNAPNASQRKGLFASIAWGALIVATLYVCYFSHLGAIGFVGPDEPRYAWIARAMAETGDWVTPRLYGRPWFEKPPLYYWGAALSFKLFGVSEAAARLPSAICALLATLAMAWLAWRVYGAETARWLLLLLPTTVGMIGFSHAAATDMPFSGMLTIAMVCAAVALGLTRDEKSPVSPRTPWAALFLFGVFLGLAVLAKGPAAIILSGGAFLFWALFTRRWKDAFRLLHPVAIVSFCVTALPWYVLCARRNPEFFRVFIIEHNFKRFLTPEFQHIQPFWYYGPILLIAFLPWTPILIRGIFDETRSVRSMPRGSLALLFLTFSAFCIVFFTASQSKLPGYILPVIPAFALAVAKTTQQSWEQDSRGFSALLIGWGASLLGVGVALHPLHLVKLSKVDESVQLGVCILLVELAAISILIGLCLRVRRSYSAVIAQILSVAWICIPLGLVGGKVLRQVEPDISARYLAEVTVENRIPLDQIGLYRVNRAREYQLNFYFHRELNPVTPGQSLPRYVVTDLQGISELRKAGFRFQRFLFGRGIQNTISLYELALPGSPDGDAGGRKLN